MAHRDKPAEPVYRDPGDRERLRDKMPDWFRKLRDQHEREHVKFRRPTDGGD